MKRIRRIKKVKEITTENNNSKVDDTPMVNLFNEIFEGQSVRIVDKDGEPWFVARDIGTILDISKEAIDRAVSKIKEEYRCSISIRDKKFLIISEHALYKILIRSQSPRAEKFQDWIAEELLPKYRKYGHVESKQRTSVPVETKINPLEWMQNALNVMVEQNKKIEFLDDKINVIDNVMKDNKRQLSLLPASDLEVNKTKRSLLNQRVRSYSKATNTQFQTAWNKVYTEYYYTYGVNIKVRAKNRRMEYLDYASSEGLMDNLYAVACEYLKLEGEI